MAVIACLYADGNLERGTDPNREEEITARTVSLNSDKTASSAGGGADCAQEH